MRKKNFKNLALNKSNLSNLNQSFIKGGFTTYGDNTTTVLSAWETCGCSAGCVPSVTCQHSEYVACKLTPGD